MKIRAWLIACFSAVWAITSLAQQGPDLDADTAQGYVQNVFHHSSVDSVNVYNGSLTIPVALGPSYPIGPKLKLQAMLVYASKVWEYNRPAQPQNEPDLHSLVADPSLGFGWNLTMGAIKKCGPTQASTCYVAVQDGAEHRFGAPISNYYKPTDASRFYLHYISGTSGYEMWAEDGNRFVFSWNVTGFDDVWNDYKNDLGRGRNGWYSDQAGGCVGQRVRRWKYSLEPRCAALLGRSVSECVRRLLHHQQDQGSRRKRRGPDDRGYARNGPAGLGRFEPDQVAHLQGLVVDRGDLEPGLCDRDDRQPLGSRAFPDRPAGGQHELRLHLQQRGVLHRVRGACEDDEGADGGHDLLLLGNLRVPSRAAGIPASVLPGDRRASHRDITDPVGSSSQWQDQPRGRGAHDPVSTAARLRRQQLLSLD